MSTVNEKMTTICNNIRAKTGGTAPLGLDEIATSIDEVYEVGKTAEHDEFWNNYIGNGNLSYAPYHFAGSGWNNLNFRPNKNLIFRKAATGLFQQSNIRNLKKCLEDCNVTLDISKSTNLNYAFAYGKIQYLPKISIISADANTQYLCGETNDGSYLISIDEIEIAETNTFVGSFNYCKNLTHVIFTGTLATNGLNLSWSTQLDHESLLSILNCLKDYSTDTSGTDWFITIGADNIAKLSEEEQLIATNKGWDIR